MKARLKIGLLGTALALTACSSVGGDYGGFSDYSAIRVQRVNVGDDSLSVVAPRPWNRHRPVLFEDIRAVEDWTLNGPLLDDMTPPEIAAMVESLYRVRGGAVDFRTVSLAPRPFLGTNGFQLDYEHLDDDELWRRGRVVGTVVNGQLYLILLDAAKSHYFDAALPDFEAIVASAQLRR